MKYCASVMSKPDTAIIDGSGPCLRFYLYHIVNGISLQPNRPCTEGTKWAMTSQPQCWASRRPQRSTCLLGQLCSLQLPVSPVLEGHPEGSLRASSISWTPLYFEPSYFSRVQMALFDFIYFFYSNEGTDGIIRQTHGVKRSMSRETHEVSKFHQPGS